MTQAAKHGLCDALFNRPCKSPWTDFKRQSEYVRGYMMAQGKERAAYEIPADTR